MPISDELRIGSELRGYRVEELAGKGGMGAVYRATDLRLRRQVALKVIAPQLAQDERFRRRFLAESEVATSLEHPHILPVYDAGEANGSLYIAMRYVEESDLRRLLREEGPLPPARTLQLLGEVADALDAAHARGLIHRDVKPSNILISGHGETAHSYLADFGLTQRAGEGEARGSAPRLAGTVDYMAPEQIEHDEVDGRADVYALGCVLYECLTGEVPFPLESDLAVLWAHMRATPPRASEQNPELPKAIDRVIERALAKDPERRFATSGDLIRSARAAFGIRELLGVRDRRLLPLVGAATAVVIVLAAAAAAFGLRGGGDGTLALRANSLVRVDPQTNRVVAVVDVGEKPISVAAAGQRVWVYNLGDNSVSAIDATTNELLHTTRISTVPWNAAYYLGPLLAAGRNNIAWVVGIRDGRGIVTRIDSRGVKRETSLDRTPVAVAVGSNAAWVLGSVSPTKTCYGVAGVEVPPAQRDTIFRLSGTTGAVTNRVRLPTDCGAAYGNVTAGGGWVWTFDFSTSTLVRIDARTSRLSDSADLGSDPFGPGGSAPAVGDDSLWVHAVGVRVIEVDPRTLRVIGGIPASPAREGGALFADGSLWWNDIREGTLVRFDPDTGRIVTSIRVAPTGSRDEFHSTAISSGTGDVWATVSRAFIDPQVP